MTTGLSYNGATAGTNSYVQQIATMAVVELDLRPDKPRSRSSCLR
jgi:hypothetical protein